MAGGWDAVPGIREQVVDLKPGHFHKADVSPWFIPASSATHHLGMEVGGREDERKRVGRDEPGKVGQTPTAPAEPKCGKDASNLRNPL